jgi:hypothetical protein
LAVSDVGAELIARLPRMHVGRREELEVVPAEVVQHLAQQRSVTAPFVSVMANRMLAMRAG